MKYLCYICYFKRIGTSYRDTTERYQHSTSTISSILHEVVRECILSYLTKSFFPKPSEQIDEKILENPVYFPWFQNCIKALDGSHIPATVPSNV